MAFALFSCVITNKRDLGEEKRDKREREEKKKEEGNFPTFGLELKF